MPMTPEQMQAVLARRKARLAKEEVLWAAYQATKDSRNSVQDDLDYLREHCSDRNQVKRLFDEDYCNNDFEYDIDKDEYVSTMASASESDEESDEEEEDNENYECEECGIKVIAADIPEDESWCIAYGSLSMAFCKPCYERSWAEHPENPANEESDDAT